MRQIGFKDGDEIKFQLLLNYIKEAIQNQKQGKEIKPERNNSAPQIPLELKNALEKDKNLKKVFLDSRKATRILPIYNGSQAESHQKEGHGLNEKYKNC